MSDIENQTDESRKCTYFNRHILIFCIQTTLAFMVISLCIAKLFLGVQSDERTIYISLMSSIISYFLPNPRIKKNRTQ